MEQLREALVLISAYCLGGAMMVSEPVGMVIRVSCNHLKISCKHLKQYVSVVGSCSK